MKGTPASLWLSAANQAAGWWMGHAANAVRAQQRAMVNEMMKPVTAKPKRSRTVRRRKTRKTS